MCGIEDLVDDGVVNLVVAPDGARWGAGVVLGQHRGNDFGVLSRGVSFHPALGYPAMDKGPGQRQPFLDSSVVRTVVRMCVRLVRGCAARDSGKCARVGVGGTWLPGI